ncbi:hypothetical protein WJX79_007623 [Trebouxia sp. C0005]
MNGNCSREKVALITGITGQDGSYLAELLLERGYEVHGIKRRTSSPNLERIQHLMATGSGYSQRLHLHFGDVTDFGSVCGLITKIRPREVYNLAAQSHVQVSFELPSYTADVAGQGVLNILEAVRSAGLSHHTRLYQASTSELYGKVAEVPQTETTPFYPRSPYAVSKLFGYWIVRNYREAYNMFACNGILFNHESPRRGEHFVTRKITAGAARIYLQQDDFIELGNLDAQRDWGHAKDYVQCMWLMLQQNKPDDFVVATGVTTTVRKFAEMAFDAVGIPLRWEGEGVHEIGIGAAGPRKGDTVVRVADKYFRPTEVDLLIGNPAKAAKLLQWDPSATSLEILVKEMVKFDLQNARRPKGIQTSATPAPNKDRIRQWEE